MTKSRELRLRLLIEKGYFPQELPPPFTTKPMAEALPILAPLFDAVTEPTCSRYEPYSMARAGYRRRELAITNPIHQYRLCKILVDSWPDVRTHLRSTGVSRTSPRFSINSSRAVGYTKFRDLPEIRAEAIAHRRAILKSDIARFYHTIYTHCIAWALHGKDIAKKNSLLPKKKKISLLGDEIDFAVRNTQDRQTVGIPVGPDTSLIIAEMIGASLDSVIFSKIAEFSGYRFIDDYFLCFKDLASAEQGLSFISSALAQYQLQINDTKTDVMRSSDFHEPTWTHEINVLTLDDTESGQRKKIQHLFDTALRLGHLYPSDSVLKYAVTFTQAFDILENNFSLYVSYLLRCATSQPNCIGVVANTIYSYVNDRSFKLDRKLIADFIDDVILTHGPLQHHSEVSWALWLSKILEIPISERAADCVGYSNSSICALIALDLKNKALVRGALNTVEWQKSINADGLYDNLWLLTYEAARKGWLPASTLYIDKDKNFSWLKIFDVNFYDEASKEVSLFQRRRSRGRKRMRPDPDIGENYQDDFEDVSQESEFEGGWY